MDGGRWAPRDAQGGRMRPRIAGWAGRRGQCGGERGPGWLAVAWDGSAMAGRAIAVPRHRRPRHRRPRQSPAAPCASWASRHAGHCQAVAMSPRDVTPTGQGTGERHCAPSPTGAATVTTVTAGGCPDREAEDRLRAAPTLASLAPSGRHPSAARLW